MPSAQAIAAELSRIPGVTRAELLSNWFDHAWSKKNIPSIDAAFRLWCARQPGYRSIATTSKNTA